MPVISAKLDASRNGEPETDHESPPGRSARLLEKLQSREGADNREVVPITAGISRARRYDSRRQVRVGSGQKRDLQRVAPSQVGIPSSVACRARLMGSWCCGVEVIAHPPA